MFSNVAIDTQSSPSSCRMPAHGMESAPAACCRPSSPGFMGTAPKTAQPGGFWRDRETWWRASKNTLNCLIGCSIGDFGMLIYLQIYHPDMPVMWVMALAMTAGLITSVLFEATILKTTEGFAWPEAFKLAFSMSFISMLGMELAANTTDLWLTGGTTSPAEPWFWVALAISLVVGFLAPLPYNYFKLRKHGKACH
jgi:hypothetical protein